MNTATDVGRQTLVAGTSTFRKTQPMRAVVIDRYGSADELVTREIARPKCSNGQVLIRVHAAGVNPIDWRIRSGGLRLILHARLPLVLGFDVAGEIVETSRDAEEQGWRVGDEVIGFLDNRHGGGYAEFAVAGSDALSRKPAKISFEEAAAVPLAASTALQALSHIGRISAGQDVLINGAAGGVGTFAVQMAKAKRANVTGVCSGRNVQFVRELGADRVIDYQREDFTSQRGQFDIIFDAVAKRTFWQCRRALTPRGCYITTVPSFANLSAQVLSYCLRRKCRNMLAKPHRDDLQQITALIADGKVRPIVQDVYSLADATAAHRTSQAGHVRGKLVLSIDS